MRLLLGLKLAARANDEFGGEVDGGRLAGGIIDPLSKETDGGGPDVGQWDLDTREGGADERGELGVVKADEEKVSAYFEAGIFGGVKDTEGDFIVGGENADGTGGGEGRYGMIVKPLRAPLRVVHAVGSLIWSRRMASGFEDGDEGIGAVASVEVLSWAANKVDSCGGEVCEKMLGRFGGTRGVIYDNAIDPGALGFDIYDDHGE